MKMFAILIIGLVAGSAAAQTNNLDRTFQTTSSRLELESPVLTLSRKPAEITVGRFTFSGIAVQAIQAPNPLQLINPFAPEEYGSGQANATPGTQPCKVIGWRFLSISF